MCGRFHIPQPDDSPEELEEVLQELNRKELKRHPDFHLKRGEIRPGDTAAVIAPDQQRRRSVFAMKWGFLLPRQQKTAAGVQLGMGDLIPDFPAQEISGRRVFNARSESAGNKALFAESYRTRRCVVPAPAYFEWDHNGDVLDKYRFYAPSSSVLWMLGLYRIQENQAEFTILTRDAAKGLDAFHDRMPLIVPRNLVSTWLDPTVPAAAVINEAITDLRWQRA